MYASVGSIKWRKTVKKNTFRLVLNPRQYPRELQIVQIYRTRPPSTCELGNLLRMLELLYSMQCCQRLGFYPNNIIRIFEHLFCFISKCKLGILGFLQPSTPIRYNIFHNYLRIWGMFLRIYCQKIMATLSMLLAQN